MFVKVKVHWVIRSSNCLNEYVRLLPKQVSWYFSNPALKLLGGGDGVFQQFTEELKCGDAQLTDHSDDPWLPINKNTIQDIQNEIEQKTETRQVLLRKIFFVKI